MHFLKKIIKTPQLENPANDHMDVHRHFYRYSRGTFIGPAVQIRKTSTKITLKGSLEYEDLIEELVLKSFKNEEIIVEGTLITGKDISEKISRFGFDWVLKESTGKTKNFKAKFKSSVNRKNLIEAISSFREDSYLLISFNGPNAVKVSSKKTLPRPSKKKPVDDDISNRVNFCKGYMENNNINNKMILEEIIEDFKAEIPAEWKKITLTNTYKINDIEIPKNVKNSRMLRIMSIRKGKLIRTLDVDGEVIEKQYKINV